MNMNELVIAYKERKHFSYFNENPKFYDESLNSKGLLDFQNQLNNNYNFINKSDINYGEEISPYLQTGLGIHYPVINIDNLVNNSKEVLKQWSEVNLDLKFTILRNSLEGVKNRFFELAYSTMHTTGQSFLMSFQASGPHACDRVLEVLAMAYDQLSVFPSQVEWSKNLGKFDLKISKNYKPISKGISLVIGCSTFPTWNTVPGLYASLISGNPVIVKPHPKAVYPIAIFVDELQKEFVKNGLSSNIVQMAIDKSSEPITKLLCEKEEIKLIDYTGNSEFGNYIESLGKICFTEKAGINSVLLNSVNDIDSVVNNIAFSVSLYSGQMCTAPQNIYIPKLGIKTSNGLISYDECVDKLKSAFNNLLNNPKAASPTLGAIQNENTIKRVNDFKTIHNEKVLELNVNVQNTEFENARLLVPSLVEFNSKDSKDYLKECFGPIAFLIKTENWEESLNIAKSSAQQHGAITCSVYELDDNNIKTIEHEMNSVFTPVSFNFIGAAFINQHAAFSDLHVSGGNPSGNATFTNSEFINKRYVWIGNRYMN